MVSFSWFSTALRIKEPARSIAYYVENFNFTLLRAVHHPAGYSFYYLTTLPTGVTAPAPDSPESEAFLWSYPHTTLQLLHHHGSEKDDSFAVNNGNVEPNRGFGHIAVNCDDVYEASARLEAKGIRFQKKPDEGRMKGLAFALDPDGYWVEIVRRVAGLGFPYFNFSQTMMRVKDPAPAIRFYKDVLGMKLLCERHFEAGKFSLFFLATLADDDARAKSDPCGENSMDENVKTLFNPVLELTHNHGTESDDTFKYHNGNTDPKGFAGIGFLVDDLPAAVEKCVSAGFAVVKKADEGCTRTSVIVSDADNYHVELIPRGLKEADYVVSA